MRERLGLTGFLVLVAAMVAALCAASGARAAEVTVTTFTFTSLDAGVVCGADGACQETADVRAGFGVDLTDSVSMVVSLKRELHPVLEPTDYYVGVRWKWGRDLNGD